MHCLEAGISGPINGQAVVVSNVWLQAVARDRQAASPSTGNWLHLPPPLSLRPDVIRHVSGEPFRCTAQLCQWPHQLRAHAVSLVIYWKSISAEWQFRHERINKNMRLPQPWPQRWPYAVSTNNCIMRWLAFLLLMAAESRNWTILD